ncbi:MAG: His/Gly/Thr/Pro-type tRNA ligase C-terminal domain-containing protein, partial [Candidatus Methanomethylophilaceae archaeon]|nr:His/Gly/Thr/Pro-type tRNA ligase C-terminal domain-containing protein [Candidatus Methanomethylophilaceae archaeon]
GSIERFIGILIEHYAGKFPTWLSPVQVKVLSVSEKSHDYAETVSKQLKAAGIRCELDNREEKIGYKIREAQMQKTPYMLILGEKEAESGNTISIRSRDKGDIGSMSTEQFISQICTENESRSNESSF